MSSEIAIKVEGLSKCYQIYDQPRDRLKQFVLPRLRNMIGVPQKQYFREFWALKDVSFEISKGESVGIIGRNGSGKSTLLQMICGTLNPSSGSIETEGRIAALLELGSGFNPEFSGRENVFMNAAVLGVAREEVLARFDEIAEFADIGEFIDQPVKTYSSGMVLRLAFSVAINVRPEILVVDEALSVGDELFQRKCFSRIEAMRASGTTILFVSHYGAQIVDLCDRAILLDLGESLLIGSPKSVVAQYQRLLYARADQREEIRRRLLEAVSPDMSDAIEGEASFDIAEAPVMDAECLLEEVFDPGFLSSQSVEHQPRGARILGAGVFTLDGRQVNNLLRGRRYSYQFRVFFDSSAVNVRFGMAIRTTSGAFLGGSLSSSSTSEAIPVVDCSREVLVDFSFICSLNPGVYFLNAVAFCDEGGDQVTLCRVIDAVAIRVLPVGDDCATGSVWFQSAVKIS